MSNRRLPKRHPLTSSAEEADPPNGRIRRRRLQPWSARLRNWCAVPICLLANEGDRQAFERGVGLIQHNLELGINTHRVQFAEPRNTAEARLISRALRLSPKRAWSSTKIRSLHLHRLNSVQRAGADTTPIIEEPGSMRGDPWKPGQSGNPKGRPPGS